MPYGTLERLTLTGDCHPSRGAVVAVIMVGPEKLLYAASSSPYVFCESFLVRLARCAVNVSEKYVLDAFLYGKTNRHAQTHTSNNTRKHELEGLSQIENRTAIGRRGSGWSEAGRGRRTGEE